jgi:hypothetical protein
VAARRQYRKKPTSTISAVRLALETEGFTYRKWGGEQHCKAGDWVVDNGSDCYTIDAGTFARTYRQVGPGTFVKVQPVWAQVAESAGRVTTKEGSTAYRAGDYLVSNDVDGSDSYAVDKASFESLYEPHSD